MPVRVIGPKDPVVKDAINTTSRSTTWSKGLSPFFLGPVELWGGHVAKNVENAWQYSKVYHGQTDGEGNPSERWFSWAKKGWDDPIAHRYPMPKGVKPLYSYWNGEKLDYVTARRRIYVPIYAAAVAKSEAYKLLEETYKDFGEVTLWDFDGYDHLRMKHPLSQVLVDQNRKMGHAFVLAMMLEGCLKECLDSAH